MKLLKTFSALSILLLSTSCSKAVNIEGMMISPSSEAGIVVLESPMHTSDSMYLQWRLNGVHQPQADRHTTHRVPIAEGENTVTLQKNVEGEIEVLKTVRLYGQEFTSSPPVIDGQIADWNDPNTIRLFPSKNGDSNAKKNFDQTSFYADIMVLWDNENVYLGANVTDSTKDANDFVEFDFFETSIQVSKKTIQLARDSNTSTMRSSETPNGYFVEAVLPISEVLPLYNSLGILDTRFPFDVKIIESSTGAKLQWCQGLKGENASYRSLAANGLGVVLPDPTNRVRVPRVQYYGELPALFPPVEPFTDPSKITLLPEQYSANSRYLEEGINLIVPFKGTHAIADGYGYENLGWTHQTISNERSANDFFCLDFGMPIGTPIYAAEDGRVITSNRRGDSYGNYIVIDHGGGFTSIYAHLNELSQYVDKGEPILNVKAGDLIGYSGESGTSYPHLHFGLHYGSRISHSGADVGGEAVAPEPLGPYYGMRKGQKIQGQ